MSAWTNAASHASWLASLNQLSRCFSCSTGANNQWFLRFLRFCSFCGTACVTFIRRSRSASIPASVQIASSESRALELNRKTNFIQPSSSHSVPWYQHHLDHPAISIWRNDAKRFSLNEHSVLAGRLLGNDKLLQVNIVRQGHFSPVTWWHRAKQSGCETTKGTILWIGKHWKSTVYCATYKIYVYNEI